MATPLLVVVVVDHPHAVASYLLPRGGSGRWAVLTGVVTVAVAALGVVDRRSTRE